MKWQNIKQTLIFGYYWLKFIYALPLIASLSLTSTFNKELLKVAI